MDSVVDQSGLGLQVFLRQMAFFWEELLFSVVLYHLWLLVLLSSSFWELER